VVHLSEDIWGTCDGWTWDGGTLTVGDYKYGYRLVEVVKNWQLITYAAAIIAQRGDPKPEYIELMIVQPRGFHPHGPIRKWKITYNEFCGYRQRVLDRVELAKEDPPCVTGPECLFCTARHACPTLNIADYNIFEVVQKAVPFDLSDEAVGKELELTASAMLLIKARLTGLEEEVISRIRKGFPVPGWKMVAGYGREDWAKPLNEVLALGALMGIDISSPGALTPKQAIKKGIPAEIVRMYSETKETGVKLQKDDARRAGEVFNGKFN
jgi:hypothetical protein